MSTRHKCFISYHVDDRKEVQDFLREFEGVFIPKKIGVTDADDFINSNDTEYVLRRIREKYLADSTVTIVMFGKCTKSRRYVDWEIASSLRDDPKNKRSGLLGINLRSIEGKDNASKRFHDNWSRDDSKDYAKYIIYPESVPSLLEAINAAHSRRTYRNPNNDRILLKRNGPCS